MKVYSVLLQKYLDLGTAGFAIINFNFYKPCLKGFPTNH